VLALGLSFALLGFLSDSMWAVVAGTVADRLRGSAGIARVQRWLGGGVLVGLGILAAVWTPSRARDHPRPPARRLAGGAHDLRARHPQRQRDLRDGAPAWERWDAAHPDLRLVAELDGTVAGWAALSPASARHCYRGVGEVSVYVAEEARGAGSAARCSRSSSSAPSRRATGR
jgi:hypothetical protein